MSNGSIIAIDHLRDGKREKIEGSFSPDFLKTNEQELDFSAPVQVDGEAYLTDEDLVLHLSAKTSVKMPCVICNEMTEVELKLSHFYHTVSLKEFREPFFDWKEPLREELFIELPQYVECNRGKCPQRPQIASYLKGSEKEKEKSHFPFAGLE